MSGKLSITFLGTGGAVPSLRRGLPAMVIEREGTALLVDCGEGTQMALLRTTISAGKIDAIFISHLHGDHIFGLPGFLTTQQMMDRKKELTVYGPRGLEQFYLSVKSITGFEIQYNLKFIEIEDGKSYPFDAFQVLVRKLVHNDNCFGFRFVEKPKPGVFNSKKADKLGVPNNELRKHLLQGKPIHVNGREILPSEIVGPPIPGRCIAYCSDTRPCKAGKQLAVDADVLVHDSTFSELHAERAVQTGHSTCTEAAMLAKDAQVQKLVLWHTSSRYLEEQETEMLNQAAKIHNDVILAQDFQKIFLNYRTK